MFSKRFSKKLFALSMVLILSFSALSIQANAAKPPSSDMSGFVNFNPGIQLGLNSCSACSVSFAKTIQESIELGWSTSTSDHIFSSSYMYNQLCGGVNQGLTHEAVLNLLVNQGCATTDLMPNNLLNFNDVPTAAARARAARFKDAGYTQITSLASDGGVDSIKIKLYGSIPVLAGIKINNDYKNLNENNDTYDSFNPGDAYSNHGICIVGYDDNKSGGSFKVLDSTIGWGINDTGFGWITYETFKKVASSAYYIRNKATQPEKINSFTQLKTGDIIALHVLKYAPVDDYVPDMTWLSYYSTYSPNIIPAPATVSYKFDNYLQTNFNCNFVIEKINPSGTANTYTDRQIRIKLPSTKSTGFTKDNLYFGYNTQSGKFEFTKNPSNLLNNGVWSLMGDNGGFYLAIPQTMSACKKMCIGANNTMSLVYATGYGGDNFTVMKY